MSAPSLLGPYELGELLAEGGTSAVYAAIRNEGSYRRPVAIKILHQNLTGTEAALRFRAERQILARLEHPNIARLYDGGTTSDGRPFLVMERIEGFPLDSYCDIRRLGLEDRLVLFLKVCGAVQYAHRNLLIHRDLKPANILVDATREPKLLDFGIAKQMVEGGGPALPSLPSLPSLRSTRFDTDPLTPSYASPEQVQGRAITTASDVYSLGVVLYRLLTGLSPYGATPARKIERAICEEEPPKPSAVADAAAVSGSTPRQRAQARGLAPERLARRLRGDLDTIALKALAKEPERRYRTVAELAEDIERHLAGLPLAAHPDTAAYVAWRFARRHRTGVGFAILLASLLAGWVVEIELRNLELAREKERAQRASSFLIAAFERAAPQVPGAPTPALAVIDSAAQSIGRDLASEPEMRARLMSSLGEAYWDQRRLPEACRLHELAHALRTQWPGPYSIDLARSLVNVSICRDAGGQTQAALAAARRSLELFRRAPEGSRQGFPEALSVAGDLLAKLRAYAEAERVLQEAVALARRSQDELGQAKLAHHLLSLSRVELGLGKDDEAERHSREAFQLEERALESDSRRLLYNEWRLASILSQLGAAPEAELRLRRIVAVGPSQRMPDVDRAKALKTLADVLAAAGKIEEGVKVGRERLALLLTLYGPQNEDTAGAQLGLARLLARQGRLREGEPLARGALATLRQLLGERSDAVGVAYLGLSTFERGARRYSEALDHARTGLAILEERLGADAPSLAAPLREIALVYRDQGKDRDALPYLQRAHALLERRKSRESARRAEVDLPLAELLLRTGRRVEAGEVLRGAQALLLAEYGRSDPRVRQCLALLQGASPAPSASPPRAAP